VNKAEKGKFGTPPVSRREIKSIKGGTAGGAIGRRRCRGETPKRKKAKPCNNGGQNRKDRHWGAWIRGGIQGKK